MKFYCVILSASFILADVYEFITKGICYHSKANQMLNLEKELGYNPHLKPEEIRMRTSFLDSEMRYKTFSYVRNTEKIWFNTRKGIYLGMWMELLFKEEDFLKLLKTVKYLFFQANFYLSEFRKIKICSDVYKIEKYKSITDTINLSTASDHARVLFCYLFRFYKMTIASKKGGKNDFLEKLNCLGSIHKKELLKTMSYVLKDYPLRYIHHPCQIKDIILQIQTSLRYIEDPTLFDLYDILLENTKRYKPLKDVKSVEMQPVNLLHDLRLLFLALDLDDTKQREFFCRSFSPFNLSFKKSVYFRISREFMEQPIKKI